MATRDTILKELGDISPFLAGIPADNVYVIPSGYFENLPENILARISTETLDLDNKDTPFTVPQNYFEGLAGNILNKIKQEHKDAFENHLPVSMLSNTICLEVLVYALVQCGNKITMTGRELDS